ncbi:MAG: hypothetical protein AVDCRST_MAG23-953, partial [uncultured Sphingosinicella sp.]
AQNVRCTTLRGQDHERHPTGSGRGARFFYQAASGGDACVEGRARHRVRLAASAAGHSVRGCAQSLRGCPSKL